MGINRTCPVGIIGLGRMGSTIDEGRHADVPDSIASACASCERLEVVAGSDPELEKRGGSWVDLPLENRSLYIYHV